MKFTTICGKQVINVLDGTLIGHVSDLEFDACTHLIHAIFVHPGQSGMKKLFPWFFSPVVIKISILEIENINGDVILVRFD